MEGPQFIFIGILVLFMSQLYITRYKNIDGVEVVAFADIRKECAQKLAEGTNADIYGDGNDLIENADDVSNELDVLALTDYVNKNKNDINEMKTTLT